MTIAATNSPIIDVSGLRITYRIGRRTIVAIQEATLAVAPGEAVGLVGESGSGKSTLARALLGLLPPNKARIEAGRICVEGQDATRLSQKGWRALRGRPLAMVFQDPLSFLNPVLRIGRQIGESIRLHDGQEPVAARIAELLDLVRLRRSVASQYAHELSGGMRQRALLAIALACRPRLLVADEPTTALDVTTQAEILGLLRELREHLGMALLLISHDLGAVAGTCDRIAVMYAGHTIEQGTPREVFATPAHPYTARLLLAARAERNSDGRFPTIDGEPPGQAAARVGCAFRPRCLEAVEVCAAASPGPVSLGATHAVYCWQRAA